jgi:hypothetical protein
LLLAGVGAGGLAWLLLHLGSDGRFTEVLELQAARFANKRGFETMLQYPPFREFADARHVHSALGWNLSEHRLAFLSYFPANMNLMLAIASVPGAIHLLRRRHSLPAAAVWAPLLWLALALTFSIFVWEPDWDHYFLQYLGPLSLLSAAAVEALLTARPGRARTVRWALGGAALIAFAALGLSLRPTDAAFFARARSVAAPGQRLLAFDPLINFLSGTEIGCGLFDPFNTYGDSSPAALAGAGPLGHFALRDRDLIACLERDPGLRVVIGPYYGWFRTAALDDYLARAPRGRLILFEPQDRKFMPSRPSATLK